MTLLELPDVTTLWRIASILALIWLAVVFGRTLRLGQIPLVERFARVGSPVMTPEFCIYTRRLTCIWCGYFIFAAVVSGLANYAPVSMGVFIWIGSIVLFVGEHRLRSKFFPGQNFPSLLRQIRDTWHVWHSA